MNRIYRKVWNRARGQVVVVSELASSGEGGADVDRRHAAALILALLGMSGSALAADAVCVDPVTGAPVGTTSGAGNEVACGDGAAASGQNSMALGSNARAEGARSVALGAGATTRPLPAGVANVPTLDTAGAVAIGSNAVVGNTGGIAMGAGAQANKRESIAIGSGAAVQWAGDASSNAYTGQIAIGNGAYTGPGAGHGALAIGRGASADSGNLQTAIGAGATVRGNITTAVGAQSIANGDTAAAFGVRAQASGYDSVAIGTDAIAGRRSNGTTANAASALGVYTAAQGAGASAVGAGSFVFGNHSGSVSATDGNQARISAAAKSDSNFSVIGGRENFSVGNRNLIGSTSSNNVAFGNDIKLGASAATFEERTVVQNGVTMRYYAPTFNGESAITNAVAIGQSARVAASHAIAVGADAQALGASSIAVGHDAIATGVDAIAAGRNSEAEGEEAVAIGYGSSAEGDDSVALGVGAQALSLNSLALGAGAVASHANSIALGAGSATTIGAQASYEGAYVGNSSSTGELNIGGRQITGVAAGSAGSDAVNVSQLQGGVQQAINTSNQYTDTVIGEVNVRIDAIDGRVTNVEGDIVDIRGDVNNLDNRVTNVEGDLKDITVTVNGFDNRVTNLEAGGSGPFQITQGETYVAPKPTGANAAAGGNGAVASGESSVAVGNQAVATANHSTALGQGATASHENSVALGSGSVTTVGAQTNYNAAYVGRSTSTGEVNIGGRTISGVGPGIAATDAVNVSQLQGSVSHAINAANQYTDQRISNVESDIWKMDRGYRSATASAMAMAGLPQAYLPGKSMLSVAASTYQREYGVAVGLSGITENGRYVYKAQASGNTARDWGVTVGAGLQW